MKRPIALSLAGYGLVGRRHAAAIAQIRDVEIASVVEPDPAARAKATSDGYASFASLEAALEGGKADGVILAVPNALHVKLAQVCVNAGCPVLIEKPIATRSCEAEDLVALAAACDVPILVGHHRRHNPLIHRAREIIERGEIGEIRAVQATCWFYKPDSYFDQAPWRRQTGAGPIAVNLVHDVDLLRYLCGDVATVRAVARPAARGGENEDVASALLEFVSGAIGTVTVSDTIVAPWSWEMTADEYPIYPRTAESCYLIGGSDASMSLPDLKVWSHLHGARDWWSPISATAQIRQSTDPLVNQILHFADVIRGDAEPLVTGEEGLRTLKVIEAIQQAASSGACIKL